MEGRGGARVTRLSQASEGEPPLHILNVSRRSEGGGAEKLAKNLVDGLNERGHDAWLAVGFRDSRDPRLLGIPVGTRNPISTLAGRRRRRRPPELSRGLGARRERVLRLLESPTRIFGWWEGREDFDFPGTEQLLDLPPVRPDVLHCHNLHVGYFDLRRLVQLSHELPVGLTLHDEWLLTGHCAYGLGCERWRVGCGSCPDLKIYPAIRRDATAENHRAKSEIYAQSRLYVSAHSQWLLDRAKASTLAAGTVDWRLLPTGIDQTVFCPHDKVAARNELGLPVDRPILLFAANKARSSGFKDSTTVLTAVRRIAGEHSSMSLLFVAVGEDGPSEWIGACELRFVPYERDQGRLARWYQSADVFLHAARSDNFPTTVLHAMACGIPVVATAVGGIPEQVMSLTGAPGAWPGVAHSRAEATGILVPAGDPEAMAAAAYAVINDPVLARELAETGATVAGARFRIDRQLDATIDWYRDIAADWLARSASA